MYVIGDWGREISIHELFSKFKCLRVLSLSHCSGLKVVPGTVGNLTHLRSLDLSLTAIKIIPNSVCSLHNLQILKLNYCDNLKELPSNLHKLTNLRRLEIADTPVRMMPMHLEKLKNLYVLSSFYVGKSKECSFQQLGRLNLHGRLSIRELQNILNPLDALAVNLFSQHGRQFEAETRDHIRRYAEAGLRTLVVTYRELDEEEYKLWDKEFTKIKTIVAEDRDALVDAAADKMERDLILLGATAVEDRLQKGIPECIEKLAWAKIKLWVLTRDRMETAVNI
ncbi:putative phospholipid-transporting ATPase 8, partial [Mucuna pruriens]